MWYLIVSIPDLCNLTYFVNQLIKYSGLIIIILFVSGLINTDFTSYHNNGMSKDINHTLKTKTKHDKYKSSKNGKIKKTYPTYNTDEGTISLQPSRRRTHGKKSVLTSKCSVL